MHLCMKYFTEGDTQCNAIRSRTLNFVPCRNRTAYQDTATSSPIASYSCYPTWKSFKPLFEAALYLKMVKIQCLKWKFTLLLRRLIKKHHRRKFWQSFLVMCTPITLFSEYTNTAKKISEWVSVYLSRASQNGRRWYTSLDHAWRIMVSPKLFSAPKRCFSTKNCTMSTNMRWKNR